MDLEQVQPVLRFKPMNHNTNQSSPSVEGMSEIQGQQNPSDSSNLSMDDLIKPPVSKEDDSDESMKTEPMHKFEIIPSGIKSRPVSDDEENEDMIKVKPPRPPRKKVKETLKEPLYEEDIIEGFSFVGFKTFEDLERMTAWSAQHNGKFPDPYSKLKLDHEKNKEKKKKKKKDKDREKDREKHNNHGDAEKAKHSDGFVLKQIDSNAKTGSSGSSSEKGYICDSDSDGDKGSENSRSEFFGSRKDSCRNGNLARPPAGVVSNSTQVGYIKQEHIPLPGGLTTESLSGSPCTTTTTTQSTTTSTPTTAPQPSAAHRLYRPYSTSPTPTVKQQAPPLSSPAISTVQPKQSYSQHSSVPISSSGTLPKYCPVPFFPYSKENHDEKPTVIKQEDSPHKPSLPGSIGPPGFSHSSSFSSHKVKPSNSEGSSVDPSAMPRPGHSDKGFHHPFGLPPVTSSGMEPYSALRNSLQSGVSSMSSMPPPSPRPIQTSSSTMLPEGSPQSDWLRNDLNARFMQSPDRGPRGLASPFLIPHPSQSPLGPSGPFVRPVLPPPHGASFLARSLEIPKIGPAPGAGFPGFPPLGPIPSPLSLRPSGSFVSPTFQANLTPKKTGKWNAMHVRIAWEIYNHQHKQTRSQLPQSQPTGPPTSLSTSSSITSHMPSHASDFSSRILNNELTKRPTLIEDKNKFAPPVLSRPMDKQNPFGLNSLVSPSSSTRTHPSVSDPMTSGGYPIYSSSGMTLSSSSYLGMSTAGATTTTQAPTTPSFGGLGSLHNPTNFSPGILPPVSMGMTPPGSMGLGPPLSNDPFGITRSLFTSVSSHNPIHRSSDYLVQQSRLAEEREREKAHHRHMEERDRERREQRKRTEEVMSGKRSPLHQQFSHRSPAPERSPVTTTSSGSASPMVHSSKRDDRPTSANPVSSSSSHYSRPSSAMDDSKNSEVTYVGERRSSHTLGAPSHSLPKSSAIPNHNPVPGSLHSAPGSYRPPMPPTQAPYPGYGGGGLPSFMDPRSLGIYGSMLPPMGSHQAGMLHPGLDPYRGMNPFLKDHMAERELLNRFNTMLANEQDRQRMAMGYPPGFFPPTSAAAAFLGSQALGAKLSQPPSPHLMGGMYPGFPGLGAPGLPPGPLSHPRLDMSGLGPNPPGSQAPPDPHLPPH